jgi:hypothetical protein
LADSGPGSLRDALVATPTNGIIDFQANVKGTIVLTSGVLKVTKNVTINGPGATALAVSGHNLSQVFNVGVGVTATFVDLTLSDGFIAGPDASVPNSRGGDGQGGALANLGSLTLLRFVIATSAAVGGTGGVFDGISAGTGGNGLGGGIFNSGILTIFDSVIAYNSVTGGTGGDGGVGTGGLGGNGQGAGIYNTGTLRVTNSTVFGNIATGGTGGGGAAMGAGGIGQGGGIDNAANSLTMIYTTTSGNAANAGPNGGSSQGGGLFINGGSFADLENALFAKNVAGIGPDVSGAISVADHLLIGDGTGSTGAVNGVNGNKVGTSGNPIDPLLGVLQFNGGPTPTLALLAGSPAIDSGNNFASPTTDQRGFHRTVNGTNDIGAYEYQPPATMTTLTSFPNPAQLGQPVTFTAKVVGIAQNSNLAPGTVTFLDGNTFLATVTLVNGSASFTTTLGPGNHTITANYSGFTLGDYHFNPSSANTIQSFNTTSLFVLGGVPGRVQVYRKSDGVLLADFAPYGANYTGGISVAVGDVNGDQFPDIITGALVGNPDVRVFDGKAILTGTFNNNNPNASLLAQWFPYALQFNVGANVAVGDIEKNGFADIVTGASVGNPDVRVYRGKDIATGTFDPNGASLIAQWFPYALQFNIGANVGVGDINKDGFADIVTGPTAGNPDVRVYNGKDIASHVFNPLGASLLAQFFPYSLNFNVGAFVTVGDVNGDGYGDVITGATSGNPDVHVYNGKDIALGTFNNNNPDASLLAQFFAYDLSSNTGVTVAAADFLGDGKAEILTGPTHGTPNYRVVSGLSNGVKPPALLEGFANGLTDGLYVGA